MTRAQHPAEAEGKALFLPLPGFLNLRRPWMENGWAANCRPTQEFFRWLDCKGSVSSPFHKKEFKWGNKDHWSGLTAGLTLTSCLFPYVLQWDSPKEQMHCLSVPHGLGVSGAIDFYAMKWKGPAYEPWLRHGTEPCLTILFPLGLLSFAESPAFFSLFVPFSPGVACPCISQFYCAKLEQVAKSWSLTYIPDMLYFKVIHRNSSSVLRCRLRTVAG